MKGGRRGYFARHHAVNVVMGVADDETVDADRSVHHDSLQVAVSPHVLRVRIGSRLC